MPENSKEKAKEKEDLKKKSKKATPKKKGAVDLKNAYGGQSCGWHGPPLNY